jgi:hypothetical protein
MNDHPHEQWSKILAYLGDTTLQGEITSANELKGIHQNKYSESPELTPEQLKAVNENLVVFVENISKHPGDIGDLLKHMREYNKDLMHEGGKPKRKSKKTRRNRRK